MRSSIRRRWWIAAAVVLGLYGVLAVLVRIEPGNALDSVALDWIGEGSVPLVDGAAEWVSWFTDLRPRLVLGFLGVAGIALTGRFRLAAAIGITAAIAAIPIDVLDWLGGVVAGRIRPSGAPFLAYPSGHTLGTIVQYGFGLYLVLQLGLRRWLRLPLLLLLALPIVLVGPARLLTGVHWATDVIGAYLLGAASVIALVLLLEMAHRRLTERELFGDTLRPILSAQGRDRRLGSWESPAASRSLDWSPDG